MRLLAELILIGALVAAGWEKSFHERAEQAIPMLAKQSEPAVPGRTRRALPARGAAPATPAPTISNGAWMWDKNHKTALDRPEHTPPPAQPAP